MRAEVAGGGAGGAQEGEGAGLRGPEPGRPAAGEASVLPAAALGGPPSPHPPVLGPRGTVCAVTAADRHVGGARWQDRVGAGPHREVLHGAAPRTTCAPQVRRDGRKGPLRPRPRGGPADGSPTVPQHPPALSARRPEEEAGCRPHFPGRGRGRRTPRPWQRARRSIPHPSVCPCIRVRPSAPSARPRQVQGGAAPASSARPTARPWGPSGAGSRVGARSGIPGGAGGGVRGRGPGSWAGIVFGAQGRRRGRPPPGLQFPRPLRTRTWGGCVGWADARGRDAPSDPWRRLVSVTAVSLRNPAA